MVRQGRPPRGRSLVAGKTESGISQPDSPGDKHFDCHSGSLGEQKKSWCSGIFWMSVQLSGGRGRNHTKDRFIETGGANKAPVLQGADSRHKFPFTPTVHELTARGGFKRGFCANYLTDRGLLHLQPNEGIMRWSCRGGFSLFLEPLTLAISIN